MKPEQKHLVEEWMLYILIQFLTIGVCTFLFWFLDLIIE